MSDLNTRLSAFNAFPTAPNVGPSTGVDSGRTGSGGRAEKGVQGPSFREQLDSINGLQQPSSAKPAAGVESLKFSNHAVDRMRSRGIHFSPEDLGRIESAVGRAQAKGAKNTLLLTDSAALIVSVKDKNVVTVMDKAALKENVFTNIDSTVVI